MFARILEKHNDLTIISFKLVQENVEKCRIYFVGIARKHNERRCIRLYTGSYTILRFQSYRRTKQINETKIIVSISIFRSNTASQRRDNILLYRVQKIMKDKSIKLGVGFD